MAKPQFVTGIKLGMQVEVTQRHGKGRVGKITGRHPPRGPRVETVQIEPLNPKPNGWEMMTLPATAVRVRA